MTTITVDPPRRTSLCVGFDASLGRSANTRGWRQHIGSKPIPARPALLPEPKPHWDYVRARAIVQLAY